MASLTHVPRVDQEVPFQRATPPRTLPPAPWKLPAAMSSLPKGVRDMTPPLVMPEARVFQEEPFHLEMCVVFVPPQKKNVPPTMSSLLNTERDSTRPSVPPFIGFQVVPF